DHGSVPAGSLTEHDLRVIDFPRRTRSERAAPPSRSQGLDRSRSRGPGRPAVYRGARWSGGFAPGWSSASPSPARPAAPPGQWADRIDGRSSSEDRMSSRPPLHPDANGPQDLCSPGDRIYSPEVSLEHAPLWPSGFAIRQHSYKSLSYHKDDPSGPSMNMRPISLRNSLSLA